MTGRYKSLPSVFKLRAAFRIPPPGRYGGSLENRTRLLREGIQNAKASVHNGFLVTSRLNVYDGFPYPYGFGAGKQGGLEPDLEEPKQVVRMLHQELASHCWILPSATLM